MTLTPTEKVCNIKMKKKCVGGYKHKSGDERDGGVPRVGGEELL